MTEINSSKDHRIPLEENTVLKVENSRHGSVVYTIQREIGRGSSCIVYHAFYINNAGDRKRVRIKECYPLILNMERLSDGRLFCENDREFEKEKEKFRNSFRINDLFADESALTNSTADTVDLYEQNRTLYIVTCYVEGRKLVYEEDRDLRSVLTIARSVAAAVGAIHRKGYVYLDLKPANIFLYRETDELIRLFDFDSPVSLSVLRKKPGVRLTGTKGFAALELMQGDVRKIGPWTDIFSLGVLVYTLLFGHTPTAKDSDEGAEFSFENSIFHPEDYQDRLEMMLTAFLHRTLAVYYRDRYQTMDEVLSELDQMLKLADPCKVFLHSSVVSAPVSFVGRMREMQEMQRWWEDTGCQILYVTGMGGIGKSTLIRKFAAGLEKKPANMLVLSAAGRIRGVVSDDSAVVIHGISRLQEESEQDYFERKTGVLKRIGQPGTDLLVLDNFSGEITEDVQCLLDMGWKTIILSRENRYIGFFRHLSVRPLGSDEEQRELFEQGLGRILTELEMQDFEKIRRIVKGHTLLLELLGRQIRAGFLTLHAAEELVRKRGFTSVSQEKIDFSRDQHMQYDTIRNIIQSLFKTDQLTAEKRVLLKEITLFYLSGMEPEKLPGRKSSAAAGQELVREGWISYETGHFMMHPLIYEVVDGWEWQQEEIRAALRIMKQQLRYLEEKDMSLSERSAQLYRTEQILHTAFHTSPLKNTEVSLKLSGEALTQMPSDREEFILFYGEELLRNRARCAKALSLKQQMDICDKVSYVYLNQEKWTESEEVIKIARKFAGIDPAGKAAYYDLMTQYYDFRLQGEYDASYGNPYLKKMTDAKEKSIRAVRKIRGPGNAEKLVCSLAEMVIFLSRSVPEKREKIRRYTERLKAAFAQFADRNFHAENAFFMSMAWYHTYVEQDPQKVDTYVKKARESAEQIYLSDLDLIEFLYQPYANMKLECAAYAPDQADRCIAVLQGTIEICDRHPDIAVYQRKKRDLLDYLGEAEDYRQEKA